MNRNNRIFCLKLFLSILPYRYEKGNYSDRIIIVCYFKVSSSVTYGGTQKQWIDEVIDLSPLLGQRFQVVFRLKSDEFIQADGMYVDDIVLETIDNNFISTAKAIGSDNNAVRLLPPPIPNPSSGRVYIPYDAALAGGKMEICTLAGQVAGKQDLPANGHYVPLDLENLPAGCYFYRIIGLNGESGWQRLTIVR